MRKKRSTKRIYVRGPLRKWAVSIHSWSMMALIDLCGSDSQSSSTRSTSASSTSSSDCSSAAEVSAAEAEGTTNRSQPKAEGARELANEATTISSSTTS